jgi:hypothetical protein
MAVDRVAAALIELRKYRPLETSDKSRLLLLLDGEPPPWVLK